jgi:hypothetical protein
MQIVSRDAPRLERQEIAFLFIMNSHHCALLTAIFFVCTLLRASKNAKNLHLDSILSCTSTLGQTTKFEFFAASPIDMVGSPAVFAASRSTELLQPGISSWWIWRIVDLVGCTGSDFNRISRAACAEIFIPHKGSLAVMKGAAGGAVWTSARLYFRTLRALDTWCECNVRFSCRRSYQISIF